LPKERRSSFSWRKANPLGSLKLLQSHHELLGLAALLLIYQLAHQVLQNVFVLYSAHRYGWTPERTGLALTFVGILAVVMQAYVVRKTARYLGEWRMVLIALSAGGIGYLIYGLAPTGMLFCFAIPVFSLVGYFSAGLQSLMTRRVGPESQGQLQGANSSIVGIAGMIGPGIFSSVFYWAIQADTSLAHIGMPFFVAAGLHLLAIGVFFVIYPKTLAPEQDPG
jgi:DHA1 family tetracycline resistance protein-like MFS transporter